MNNFILYPSEHRVDNIRGIHMHNIIVEYTCIKIYMYGILSVLCSLGYYDIGFLFTTSCIYNMVPLNPVLYLLDYKGY